MIRRLLSAVAILLLASTAHAAPINLLLTLEHFTPASGPPEISYRYRVFMPGTFGTSGSAEVLPGVRQFEISVDVDSLDDVYLDITGFYHSVIPGQGPVLSVYYAPPPGLPPSELASLDELVMQLGSPPPIPLAGLGDGFSGHFQLASGDLRRGSIGRWAIEPAPVDVSPVPEPASMLLFGSGLAAVAAKKYRLSKAVRGR